MAVAKKIFYKKNSQYLQVSGLKDQSAATLTYIDDATLTATLITTAAIASLTLAAGDPVPGMDNVAGQFVASSNGVYRFPVDPNTFDPPVGTNYTLIVDGTSGTKKYHAEFPVQVVVRNLGTEV